MRAPRLLSLLCATATVAAGLSTVAVVAAPQASAASTDITINEVESNGDTRDWIELTNVGAAPVDVSGWVLMDNQTRTLAVPAGTTVAPGGFVAIDVDDPAVTGSFGLGGNDSARVFLPDGTTLVDTYVWAAAAAVTYGRCPDGTGAFVTTVASTKGAANTCAATPADLRISEVESSDGTDRDWIELVNPTSAAIDASGLVLKDSDDTRDLTVPAGSSIAAGGYLAIDVDDPAVTGQFGLGSTDSARLFQADGATLIDSYSWTGHAVTTFGRCPGVTGSFVTTGAATKAAANNCGAPPSTGGGIVFNEVESNADTVGDFAEVVNTSSTAIDISDWKFTDSEPERVGHVYSVPAGTVVQPGAYFVFAEAAFGFGLGAPDGVRLLRADGTTVVDTYSWTAHAATTYGRCPDQTGPVTTTTSSTRGAANDCRPPVKINEVESNGGTPGDWVELLNTGSSAVDVSGFVLKDADDTHSAPIAAGTTIPAGGYLVLDENVAFTFGLGQPDSARLFAADGTTLIDSYAWTTHATTTYGRCPDGTGDLATTQVPTKGAANTCPGDIVAAAWPGGQDVTTIDPQNTFQSNLSGLVYEPSGASAPGAIWAVRNGPGALYRLTRTETGYAPSADFAAAGKLLHYPDGLGDVDAEGVTFTSAGPGAGIFVASERNNAANSVSRPAILRFDPAAGSTDLTAQRDWNLTADLPGLGANLGLEAIAWVPDSYLTARGFVDGNTNAAYTPATYPGHGDGLFLVGVEQTGRVYAYALDQASDAYTRVASFASGFTSVMELSFEPETQQLWVVCDDTCQGRSARFDVDATGVLAPVQYYERPTGMPNLNNEGFTLAPRAECVSGRKPAFWSDDSSTGGYALRQGTVSCTAPVAQTVAFTSTAPSAPVVGQTYVVSATGGPSGNPVTFAESSDACTLAGDTVTIIAPAR